MKNSKLGSMINSKVVTLSPESLLEEALETLANKSVSSLVIVDENIKPLGIFTEHDALKSIAAKNTKETPLSSLMSTKVTTVTMNENIHDVYLLMSNKGYRHIVVVDENGVLIGLATQGDFLRHISLEKFVKFKLTKDVMKKSLLRIDISLTIEAASLKMDERSLDYAIVMQKNVHMGLISERDLILFVAKGGDSKSSVTECWHTDYPTVNESIALHDSALMMEEHGVHQLIVVNNNNELVGLLGRNDVLDAIHGEHFSHLINLVDEKSSTITKMQTLKKELQDEKETLEISESKFRALFEMLPYGVIMIDMKSGLQTEFNTIAHQQLGYSADEFHLLKISDYEAIENEEEHLAHLKKIQTQGHDFFETKFRCKDGSLIDAEVNVVFINILNYPYLMAVCRDITEKKKIQQAEEENKNAFEAQANFLHTLVNTIPDLIWMKDIDGKYLACNQMFERLFGAKEADMLGKTDFEFVDAELAQFFRDHDRLAIEANGSKSNEEYLTFADGSHEGFFDTIKTPMKDTSGNIIGVLGVARDVTQRKLHEEKLETLANFDSLTGLANRTFLLSHLQNIIDKANRNNRIIGLLLFDLDRFKNVNDSFGHQAGDELLINVAKRFQERMRDGDLIARLGGDEFAIVLDSLTHAEDAGRIAQEMIDVLNVGYSLSGKINVHVGASAGIVISPTNGNRSRELLQFADAALYKAKNDGRGTYRYYTDELTEAARRRVECETNLRRALENEEFEVYYQPQVHISTDRIIGAEALVRWNDPVRGIVSPTLFIPLAEETGMIADIGEWVLNETCRQGKVWMEAGHRLTLAVNVSAHQLRHQDIIKIVDNAIKKSGFKAELLELELTESALMEREEELVETLHRLRARGIRLAIDDFGTGYSSLSYLKRFPIDVLKIDKSFVDDLPFADDDMAIVTAIIAMGNALGFQILAEGTERKEQIDFLAQRGCTMYQGYYKSKPLPASEFEKLLN